MQVELQMMTGKVISVGVEPSETIKSAKARVQEAEGIPSPQQRWVLDGKTLDDKHTFEECQVEADATIHLILSKQRVRISIRTLCGSLHSIEMEACSSVESLKAKIEETVPGCFNDFWSQQRMCEAVSLNDLMLSRTRETICIAMARTWHQNIEAGCSRVDHWKTAATCPNLS